jgi:uncharacterized membrane protein
MNKLLLFIVTCIQCYNVLFSLYYCFYIGVGNMIPEKTAIDTICLNLAIELPILVIPLMGILIAQYWKIQKTQRIVVLLLLLQSVVIFFSGICFPQFTSIMF